MTTKDKSILDLESILNEGYGLNAQRVMRDSWLSIGAKALYGYLTSFAGAGGTCFPSRDIMTYELDINKDSFTKYLRELKESGYVKVHKNNAGGKRENNIYEIVFNKKYIEACICNRCDKKDKNKKSQRPKKSDMKISDMVFSDMEKSDMKISDSNSNSINNNSINNKSFKDCMYVDKEESVKEFSKLYQSNIGMVNGIIAEQLIEWSGLIEVGLFKRAIEICTEKGNLNLGYLKGIIKKWLDANITTLEKLEAQKLQANIKNNKSNTSMSTKKENIPKVKTRYHNINQSFNKYSDDDLEKILLESQKGKFK